MDSRRLRLKSLPVLVAPDAAYVPQVTWCAEEPPPNWFMFVFGWEHLLYSYHGSSTHRETQKTCEMLLWTVQEIR